MFIELVDALRCPNAHEESWLVVSATNLEARHIREGLLGCPICHAEYPVRDGIADLRRASDIANTTDTSPPTELTSMAPAEHLAAMMNLADPLGFAVLTGRWGERAEELLDLADGPPLLLVDPPRGVLMRPGLSGVRAGVALPLATGAARAVAADTAGRARIASAADATRVGGRVVAPAGAPLPAGLRELVRDDAVWVAEREARASSLVTLHVRRG